MAKARSKCVRPSFHSKFNVWTKESSKSTWNWQLFNRNKRLSIIKWLLFNHKMRIICNYNMGSQLTVASHWHNEDKKDKIPFRFCCFIFFLLSWLICIGKERLIEIRYHRDEDQTQKSKIWRMKNQQRKKDENFHYNSHANVWMFVKWTTHRIFAIIKC